MLRFFAMIIIAGNLSMGIFLTVNEAVMPTHADIDDRNLKKKIKIQKYVTFVKVQKNFLFYCFILTNFCYFHKLNPNHKV